jgi:hypothetical protein
MKKILLLLTVFTMVFTSCNPLEDVNAEIDAITNAETMNDGLVDDLVITLTEADYTSIGLNTFYFSTEEEAKVELPTFLTETYPRLGVDFDANGVIIIASSAVVTYNLFNPISAIAKKDYELVSEDYTAIGLTALNSNSDVNTFFSAKFPDEIKGTVYNLTYNTNPIITDYTLVDDDYDLVGNGRFDNFDIRVGKDDETIEARRAKIQTILLNNFPDALDASKYNVTYEAYDGSTFDLEMSVVQQQNSPDPALTTDYTLTNADFASVGNGGFNNFDIRVGGNEETVEARRVKIETILLANFPSATAGDLYNVTYAVWEGFASSRVMLLEFDGTGYTIFSTSSYELYTFALVPLTERLVLTDDWDAPITFTSVEYGIMGGSSSYSNFSGSQEEAERKIQIYMKTLFPFAAADDFVAVEYKFFSGSVSTININLEFDGINWIALSETTEVVLQFGHDGTTWVPDNTIKYTLTNADYELVDNGNFDNFDVRAGKDEFEVSARLAKINTILLNNFPQYGLDQKFTVSYNVWEPGDNVYIMSVIHNGTEYILQ